MDFALNVLVVCQAQASLNASEPKIEPKIKPKIKVIPFNCIAHRFRASFFA